MKIEKLEIETTNIQQQFAFYSELLGLPVVQKDEDQFSVQIGYSSLKFQQKQKATPYHIAFHIPAYFEEKALAWLKERVKIQSFNSEKKNEIVDFSSWNAKSIYFYDKDRNILEFISRRYLSKSPAEKFSVENMLGIAEIGLATTDVKTAFDFLQQEFSLKKYAGDLEKFCPIGDDEGLLITIDKDKKDWFPTDDIAYASPFVLQFEHAGKPYGLSFKNNILKTLFTD